MPQPVWIIGIGDDGMAGVAASAIDRIRGADLLIGTDDALRFISDSTAQRLVVGSDLDAVVREIESHPESSIVVLASGDPLFYGMARYLWGRLGKERFEVVPHVSTMQMAFARIKESWDDAYLANLAAQPLERVLERVRTVEKAGLFTTAEDSPSRIAQALIDRGLDYFTAYVCENLGSPDERVTSAELSAIASQSFAELNVMILVRHPDRPDRPLDIGDRRLFGNRDEAFLQSKPKRGLLTPAEVRAVALSELDLGRSSLMWDVGAGSGAVAIEAAQIACHGRIFAIEMDPEDYQLIQENARRFRVDNVRPVLGKAPDAWSDLPDPDAVFVGGTGRQVREIAAGAFQRLRRGGRLVVHVASLQNVTQLYELLLSLDVDPQVWLMQHARGTPHFDQLRFEGLNPSFLIAAVKER